jgi:hypothetical protein
LGSDGAVATANVGTYAITPSDAVFGKGSPLNYNITYAPGTMTVDPASLTIAAQSDSKVYDSTRISSVLPVVVAGLQNSDTVSSLVQRFDSKNVLGTDGSVLNVTGYSINDGNGGNNYSVTLQPATGTIAPLAVTLSAPTGVSRTYNGTTVYTPTLADRLLWDGHLAVGDAVSAASLNFDDKNAATGKILNFDSVAIDDGNGGGNYSVTLQNGSGDITRASLLVGALPASKALGDLDPMTLGYTVTNLFDPITTVLSGALERETGELIGSYTINIGSLALLDTQNYNMTFVPGMFKILAPPVVQQITQTSVNNGTPEGDTTEEEKEKEEEQVLAEADIGNDQGSGLPDNLPVCR